jgi:subfamily B ATP-binding cassette protein MsbA
MEEDGEMTRREQLRALIEVVKFKPVYFAAVVVGGVFAALLEGIGLSFIIPIIELVQSSGDPVEQAGGLLGGFVSVYGVLGIPFTLGTVVVGVSLVLTVRWTSTFLVRWLKEVLVVLYIVHLQERSFELALSAEVEYFDREGSDDILNAIVTQAEYAGRSINDAVNLLEQFLIALVYLIVALALAPTLTVFAIMLLGGFSYLLRNIVEPGYEIGDEVAEANERIQQSAQAGTQGIRETKLFNSQSDLYEDFKSAIDQYSTASQTIQRNKQAIQNFYNLLTAISVFVLIYLAITFANLSIGALGVFLFAMFRLGPKASSLNSIFYSLENKLPHLVRMQDFLEKLERNQELTVDSEPVPESFERIEFDEVSFSYRNQDENALEDVSFEFAKGEFVGFAGQSGAGKSTIAALLARMYRPESGRILVNGTPIARMDIDEYRSKIALVSQNPYIFNDTLRSNLTVGNRGAGYEEIERVSRISRIDDFFDDLPDGYDTELGDDGVRLSGGQRQRVALARALLKDDAQILLLDEATSDLDSRLEKEVQAAIERMDRDYTVVAIAHRLSTLQNADRIYTVEDGRITEVGEHNRLVDMGGTYAELYAIQSEDL